MAITAARHTSNKAAHFLLLQIDCMSQCDPKAMLFADLKAMATTEVAAGAGNTTMPALKADGAKLHSYKGRDALWFHLDAILGRLRRPPFEKPPTYSATEVGAAVLQVSQKLSLTCCASSVWHTLPQTFLLYGQNHQCLAAVNQRPC